MVKKILTYRWHPGHQYELWKLPYEFTLSFGKTKMVENWDYRSRPLHDNARFKHITNADDLYGYELAILHFDEFALHPELSNGVLPDDWGEQFKFLRESFKGPMVAVCHGVPIYKGVYNSKYDLPDLGQIIDSYRTELVDYLGDILVVCNSYQAQSEWGFRNSKVIWHGFDPLMYPPTDYEGGIITVCGGINQRHYYRGLDLYRKVMERIKWKADFLGDDLPNSIRKPFIDRSQFNSHNEWAIFNYTTYIKFIRQYGIFFNPTLCSPMPRSRAEAMMCGLVIVTANNHDASKFIDHGYNGYVLDDFKELADILTELSKNKSLRRKVGSRGRDTAIDLFHINYYLREWEDIIASVVNNASRKSETVIRRGLSNVVISDSRTEKAEKILYVSGVEGGSNRYRVEFAVESLQRDDIYVNNVFINKIQDNDISSLLSPRYQVIVCHRVAKGEILTRIIDKANKEGILVIYDIDDLLFDTDYAKFVSHLGRKSYDDGLKDVDAYRSAISLFNYATCTTEYLKNSLEMLGVSNVEIVPNTYSNKLFIMSNAAFSSWYKSKQIREHVIIGYPSGSATHKIDLEVVIPTLIRILTEYPQVKLCLMGMIDVPRILEQYGDRIICKPFIDWLLLPYSLAELDICIAPLENTKFTNSKSNIKYIESSLVRIPIIASATEPYLNTIEQGVTGFTALNEEQWYEYLRLLVTNKQLREKVGQNAYNDVIEKYSPIIRSRRSLEVFSNWIG